MIIVTEVEGKMSTFGGPDDHGVTDHEGLALYQSPFDMNRRGYGDYLVSDWREKWPRVGLARLLNPNANYIACRWNEITQRGPEFIRRALIEVRNPATALSITCIAVDYGPATWTNRICDLSPGAAKSLGLVTDDHCIVMLWADSDDDTNQPSAFLDDV
ncbi:MAG: hypothetical protein NTY46_05405 [Candidatus Sumerlaeota bacterium]|nr:hypothetical protein [Candidatus Sumerlaeota bacterium]